MSVHRHRHHLPDRITVLCYAVICALLVVIWLLVARAS